MTTIAILPEAADGNGTHYRAVGGGIQTVGKSAGEALDALTAQIDPSEAGTLIVIQTFLPDRFFSTEQKQRLGDLMTLWRKARDAGTTLPAAEQRELEALTQTELEGALERTAELRRGFTA